MAEGGMSLKTSDPRLRALLHVLYDVWPKSLDYAAATHVLAEAVARSAGGERPPQAVLDRMLHQAVLAQLVSTHLLDLPVATTIPAQPAVSPVARYQAGRSDVVTNLFHQSVDVEPLDRVRPRPPGRDEDGGPGRVRRRGGDRGRGPRPHRLRPPVRRRTRRRRPLAALVDLSLTRLLASCYILA